MKGVSINENRRVENNLKDVLKGREGRDLQEALSLSGPLTVEYLMVGDNRRILQMALEYYIENNDTGDIETTNEIYAAEIVLANIRNWIEHDLLEEEAA